MKFGRRTLRHNSHFWFSLYGDCAIASSCQHLNSFYKTHSLVLLPNACYPQHSVICTDVKMQRSLQLNCSLCGQALVLFTLMACRCFQPSVHMAKGFCCFFVCFSTPELQKKKVGHLSSCSIDLGQIVCSQMDPIWANANDSHFHGKWKFHGLSGVSWSKVSIFKAQTSHCK